MRKNGVEVVLVCVGKHSVRLFRMWIIAVIGMFLGTGIILLFDTYAKVALAEKAKYYERYGLNQRIPWTTSRVVGAPDANSETDLILNLERRLETFVGIGRTIFNGKGTCHSCHTIDASAGNSRGPDLANIGAKAATRRPGMAAKAYLVESLYDPTAFLVPGYDETMTPAWKPPISLSNLEIEAVVTFLQSEGGEADLAPIRPPIDIQTIAKEMETRSLVLESDPERGRDIFVNEAKCIACHEVDGIEKPEEQEPDAGIAVAPGPNLTDIAAFNSIGFIEESTLQPNAQITKGYGLATVKTSGAVIQGTLVSQNSEIIVLRIKEDNGSEVERTVRLGEIDSEPIEALVDLKTKGYFWVQVSPSNSTEPISGDLLEDDVNSITLNTVVGTRTVSKSNLKVRVSLTTYDGEHIVGELISENADEIILTVNGNPRTIDKNEELEDEPIYSRAFGKRIGVESPMPTNYSQLLTVADFNHLLVFLSTLTGKAAGEKEGPALSVRVKKTFTNVEVGRPVYIEPEPGTNELLVVDLGGRIYRIEDNRETDTAQLLLDTGRETFGLAFHPNYVENGHLYVFSNGPKGGKPFETSNYVSRYIIERHPPRGYRANSEQIIMNWRSHEHNGGALAFGHDGYLYISAGDGSMDSDTNITGEPGAVHREPKGQDITNILATIMRIDVNRPDPGRPYSIPKDNPFVDFEGARPEIWVYGIRNPWRMTFDRETGHLWAGNVGQDQWEMIHLVRRGENYGWSLYEGSHAFYLDRKPGPTPIVKPTVEHSHAESRSITGGVVYYGSKFPELRGAYIYGDYVTGKIWGLQHDGEKLIWHRELSDTANQIVSFGVDHRGEILIADLNAGIFAIERAPLVEPKGKFPNRLSDTGLFASVKDHKPVPAAIPYSLNVQGWFDGAHVQRYIGLPGNSQIDFRISSSWGFPNGTVLVQTLGLDLEAGNSDSRRRIETRLLTRQADEWVGYSYIWNDDQTDATLVPNAGLDRVYTIKDAQVPSGHREQTWRYPSRDECMVCHTRAAGFVLGLNTVQMNKLHDYNGVSDNQLRALNHIGAFSKPLEKSPAEYPNLVNPYDRQEPLAARARSYLHANCSNCHVHTGGGNSLLEVEFNTPYDKTNMFNAPPLHDTFGISDAKLVAPGSPERSILYRRISRGGQGHMPPVGTSQVDRRAAELIRDWIAQMEPFAQNGGE